MTANLMKKDEVTIFEAAFLHDGLFIRVDILKKSAIKIDLIEVKAASLNFSEHETFFDKRN